MRQQSVAEGDRVREIGEDRWDALFYLSALGSVSISIHLITDVLSGRCRLQATQRVLELNAFSPLLHLKCMYNVSSLPPYDIRNSLT